MRPAYRCACEVRGRPTPACAYAHCMSPEQSNPAGPLAPQTYGRPSACRAAMRAARPRAEAGAPSAGVPAAPERGRAVEGRAVGGGQGVQQLPGPWPACPPRCACGGRQPHGPAPGRRGPRRPPRGVWAILRWARWSLRRVTARRSPTRSRAAARSRKVSGSEESRSWTDGSMPPERYCAPAIEPRDARIRLTSSWVRAAASWALATRPRSRPRLSRAALYCSVARSASP